MLGTLRLCLAILVALSHADVRIANLNPGVTAVVCFYLISGYVMTGLLRTYYANAAAMPLFYLDRALRIFPQYLAVACLTLAWFAALGHPTAFLRQAPHWTDLLSNLTVVPLNYFMFNGADRFTLVPPAWSLGAEIQFYLLMPLLLLFRLRALAFLLGLAVFGAATWGFIDTDTFGYRLLPGVLVFFLAGSALYDARIRGDGSARRIVIGGAAATALCWLVLQQSGHLALPYNRETLVGLLIGLPLLYWLGALPQRALDNRLGDLSYGVFLNHFLVQWALIGQPLGWPALVTYLALTLMLSVAIQYLIERPVLRWRRQLRQVSPNGR